MGWFGSSKKKTKDTTPTQQSKIDPKAAQSVTTLTGCTVDEAIALLRQTNGDVTAAVNKHLDAHPPQPPPDVRLSEHGGAPPVVHDIDTEDVKEDLKSMSIKELKKFVVACDWSLDKQSITEKAPGLSHPLFFDASPASALI